MLAAAAAELPESEVEGIQLKFERHQLETQSFQAELKQTMKLRGVRDPIVSSGRLYYKAPDRLLIEFRDPKGEYILLRGDELSYKKRGKPESRHRLPPDEWIHGPGMLLELFRSGGRRFEEYYNVGMERRGTRLMVHLTRRSEDDQLPLQIKNQLLAETLTIEAIHVITDSDVLSYELARPLRNKPIDPAVFDRRRDS